MLRDARCCSFYPTRLFPGPGIFLYGRALCASQILAGAFIALYQLFSEPHALALEKQTGMKVAVLHSIYTVQTAGSVTRLTAEKQVPQKKSIKSRNLKRKDVLALFLSLFAKHIPKAYRKLEPFCLGFLAWNRATVGEYIPEQAAKQPPSVRSSKQAVYNHRILKGWILFPIPRNTNA